MKIYSVMGLLVAVAVGILSLSLVKMGSIKGQVDKITTNVMPMVDEAGNLSEDVLMYIRTQKNMALCKTDEGIKKYADLLPVAAKEVADTREKLGKLIDQSQNSELKTLAGNFDSAWEKMSKLIDETKELDLKNTTNKANVLYRGEAYTYGKGANTLLGELLGKLSQRFEKALANQNIKEMAEIQKAYQLASQITSNIARTHQMESFYNLASSVEEMDKIQAMITPVREAMKTDVEALGKCKD
jgi:hypothetical protein